MTINCKGNLIALDRPKVMGIVNLTPDSFYDGGKSNSVTLAVQQVDKMLAEGATFIDLGAYSSRPNAKHITTEEEMQRILPVVQKLVTTFPEIILSIDTFRSEIAKACIHEGAAIINDISAGNMDKNMMQTVGHLNVPYIMMHMKGTPQNMQESPEYKNVTLEVLHYFSEKIALAKQHKINDIIVDPGFGFGKTITHNYQLANELELFQAIDFPLLAGFSRKSMIYNVLETDAQHALNGTTALNTLALYKGAKILRVHDVKEAMECIQLIERLKD